MKTMPLIALLSLSALGTAATAAEQASATPAAPKPQSTAKAAAAAPAHVELDTTQITGNRELPRVLYVVPWKKADLVDRDVFRRQVRYHEALQPDAAAPAKADAAGGER